MSRLFLFIIVTVIIVGCSPKSEFVLFNQSSAVQEGTKAENSNRVMETKVESAHFEYKIRPHDRVSIITYKRPELSTNINQAGGLGQGLLVNANGYIRLPLIYDVKIAGLTQRQAQLRLESKLKEYLRHPSVQLEVMNKRAFVLGEVNNPGPIVLNNEQIPLLQLLSVAGDLTLGANRETIMVMKNYGNRVQTKIVSLTDVNSIATANQMIRPNDIVYVLPKGMKIFNNKVNEINPVFQLVANALAPFLSIQLLTTQ